MVECQELWHIQSITTKIYLFQNWLKKIEYKTREIKTYSCQVIYLNLIIIVSSV